MSFFKNSFVNLLLRHNLTNHRSLIFAFVTPVALYGTTTNFIFTDKLFHHLSFFAQFNLTYYNLTNRCRLKQSYMFKLIRNLFMSRAKWKQAFDTIIIAGKRLSLPMRRISCPHGPRGTTVYLLSITSKLYGLIFTCFLATNLSHPAFIWNYLLDWHQRSEFLRIVSYNKWPHFQFVSFCFLFWFLGLAGGLTPPQCKGLEGRSCWRQHRCFASFVRQRLRTCVEEADRKPN